MAEQPGGKFWDALLKSGLLDRDAAEKLRAECLQPMALPEGDEETIERFAFQAKRRGLLTDWQVKKLREGKYKGFFWGEYVFLDYLGEVEGTDTRAYLTRQTTPPFLEVVFEITKPQGDSLRDIEPVMKYVRRSNQAPD